MYGGLLFLFDGDWTGLEYKKLRRSEAEIYGSLGPREEGRGSRGNWEVGFDLISGSSFFFLLVVDFFFFLESK